MSVQAVAPLSSRTIPSYGQYHCNISIYESEEKMTHLLLLPFPPSVNGLYAGQTRRYKSRKYREWSEAAGYAINIQRAADVIKGEVKVIYEYGRPADKRRRDVTNYEKAVSDALVENGVFKDDSQIVECTVRWSEGRVRIFGHNGVKITIEEIV